MPLSKETKPSIEQNGRKYKMNSNIKEQLIFYVDNIQGKNIQTCPMVELCTLFHEQGVQNGKRLT